MVVTDQCHLSHARQGTGAWLAVCTQLWLNEVVLAEQPRVQALGLGFWANQGMGCPGWVWVQVPFAPEDAEVGEVCWGFRSLSENPHVRQKLVIKSDGLSSRGV